MSNYPSLRFIALLLASATAPIGSFVASASSPYSSASINSQPLLDPDILTMYGGSELQGRSGTVWASGLGRALHFDLQNAAERIYLTLSTNPYRYSAHSNTTLPE